MNLWQELNLNQTNLNTNAANKREMMNAPHSGVPIIPSQARWMMAAPSSEINKRSPRVVSRPKTPRRGEPPGYFFSRIIMVVINRAITIKNAAVGQVQAIQVRLNIKSSPSYSSQGKALGNVVADKIDYECAWDDGQSTGCSKQT